ncbi:hypothetical protein FC96_GL001690 [Secundilactobacillus kimchicus JCM 15530]|uniref:Extracellular protein n=1 Tax=Secundilactobacillus kimchicus JCM 15530 TaxID=1302272 RepID=A0A0R1HYJ7_9LACO|nr:hypothetical protein FC96_GL001690 [Secundilactobacillus kimchicus JCM 15530]
MRKWGRIITSIILMMLLGQPVVARAKWHIYHQKSSALVDYHRSRMRVVNDRKVQYKKVPKRYAHMSKSSTIHEIKATQGRRATFKTRYLLPNPGKNGQRWGNPQSIAISKNRIMSVVYCPTNLKNKGRIVQFDLNRLDQAGVIEDPASLQTVFVKHKGHYSQDQKTLQHAIKVGPLFTTGHGQSLAYNFKTHGLYMWRDCEKRARVPVNKWGYIQHINAKSLRPDRLIRFRLRSHGLSVPGGHTLAFDGAGNAYFWTNPGFGGYIYKGHIGKKHVTFRLTRQILKHIPGTRIQSMGYNPVRKRLYLISDGSIASFSSAKLKGRGHLTNRSFDYSAFTPKREFEGLAYDQKGHAYLLVNHQPEVLVANRSY